MRGGWASAIACSCVLIGCTAFGTGSGSSTADDAGAGSQSGEGGDGACTSTNHFEAPFASGFAGWDSSGAGSSLTVGSQTHAGSPALTLDLPGAGDASYLQYGIGQPGCRARASVWMMLEQNGDGDVDVFGIGALDGTGGWATGDLLVTVDGQFRLELPSADNTPTENDAVAVPKGAWVQLVAEVDLKSGGYSFDMLAEGGATLFHKAGALAGTIVQTGNLAVRVGAAYAKSTTKEWKIDFAQPVIDY